MNDESLEALRSFDRPHPLNNEARARLEARMLATYAAETETAEGSLPPDSVMVIDLRPEGTEPQGSRGRALGWLTAAAAVAAAVATLALWPGDGDPSPQQTASDDQTVTEEPDCIVDLDPLAIALDRARVNPTAENTGAVEAELERTVDRLRAATGDFDAAEAITGTDTDLAQRLALLAREIDTRASAESCRLDRFAPPSAVGDYVPEPAGIDD